MKRLFALLPIAGLATGSIIIAAAVGADVASAQECKVDNGGLCQPEGAKCTDGNQTAGRCKTRAIGTREFVCECKTGGRNPRPNRSERPNQPSEQPQEETPE